MNEIKIRTWSEKLHKYIGVWGIYKHEGGAYQSGPFSGAGKPYINELFTGLLDKNGIEIYEGDVIRTKSHHPEKMEIRFIEGGFCAWWGNDDYPIDIAHFYDSTGCCLEVIGNIHENPELLEKVK